MPSTRKQKAKDRSSRETDFVSDIENIDVLLGSPRYGNLDDEEDKESEMATLENPHFNRLRSGVLIEPESSNKCPFQNLWKGDSKT